MPLYNLCPLGNSECELTWTRVSADINMVRIKMRSSQSRVDPKSNESGLIRNRKRPRETQEDRSRDWRDVSTSQEIPRSLGKAGRKAWEELSL